ncbi:MAG: hypothetical protein COT28_17955 [Methylobacterium sp. CG08_land_8_20_14_0_20_71_15]|uniref:DUF4214 domain-containing protein n=2 Tax=Methylobacteriaceae TaxID=119045 RepID=A0ABQ4STA0_9HYPH|nr:MAG: hypothetical protein COT56_13010 [Methylobacterium sp. CG09_land_8_20_14_0_10_71_15]PIU11826.1 MAG: hypothetical protein COT28_17955 [Methylobacterium sp. CG08_land_8_20_14_0_20_71_15]GBU19090.1 hypothetical protein AwMethylo_33050 [Methylobacterium sp.]GJE06449.1 hypothetical protein AOPFMNJM_1768 [Methylobacterium jeotgali]
MRPADADGCDGTECDGTVSAERDGESMAARAAAAAALAGFAVRSRFALRRALADIAAERLDALADGSGRPSFLPAEADDLIGTDPGAGSELLVYARPVAAPAATPYRLHAALAAGLAAPDCVARAYEAILGRPADAGGAAAYAQALAEGRLDRLALLRALAASEEGRGRGLAYRFAAMPTGRPA